MMGLLSVTAVGSAPVSFDRRSQCSTESTTEALGIPRESHLKQKNILEKSSTSFLKKREYSINHTVVRLKK